MHAHFSLGFPVQGGVKHDLVAKGTLASRGLKFEDEDAVKAALAAVRADSNPTDWFSLSLSLFSSLVLVCHPHTCHAPNLGAWCTT